MDIKPRPNRKLYVETLRRMTAEQRLMKALELSEMSRDLTRAGLRARFPDASDEEIQRLFLERLERCRRRTCRDATAVYAVQAGVLDEAYLDDWAEKLRVRALLDEVRAAAG